MRLARDKPEVVEKARLTMERQLMQLVRLTDDLLDVARITQDKLEMRRERIDLRTVLQTAIDAARPAIDGQAHSIQLDLPGVPLWADADPTRLAQVFSNLLNNAVKYTARGGHIHVNAAAAGADVVLQRARTTASAFPTRCCRTSSTCSRSFPGIATAATAGSASA